MFESAELGHAIEDAKYERAVKRLRGDLLDAQTELLADKSFPFVILVNGVDGAGKGETVNLLLEWLDPRHVRSHAFGPPSEDERDRPPMWRFWQALPAKGKIGILFGNWYTDPIVERAFGRTKDADVDAAVERIRTFEKLLTDDGVLLVKLWFHLSKKAQRRRLRELEKDKLTRWRVTKDDWESFAHYRDYARVSERVLSETSTGDAPWLVIDGSDANYRALTAGRAVLASLRARLAAAKEGRTRARLPAGASTATLLAAVDTAKILRDLPFEERLGKEKYETKVEKARRRLASLARSPKAKKHSVVVVYEGMDAAGKGGAIRRVTAALDARRYEVIPIAAPSEEERAHPYLWRFWRHLPRRGRFVLFDRSWYGRVLVERVEGFAEEAAWTRAYREINEFEEQLTDDGTVVVKLWLAVSKDEQLRRFKEREEIRHKKYKITQEDWRNRRRWDDYLAAASDMIDRTSTSRAPWTIIEANDKHLARVRAIEAICERMEAAGL